VTSAGQGAFGGEKMIQECVVYRDGSEASGREGNLVVFLGAISCLAIQMLFGEVFARNSAQYEALALVMALK